MKVYIIKSGEHYKIGKSNIPGQRIKQIAVGCSIEPSLIHVVKNPSPRLEKIIHQIFIHKRINREWFSLENNDIENIKRIRPSHSEEQIRKIMGFPLLREQTMVPNIKNKRLFNKKQETVHFRILIGTKRIHEDNASLSGVGLSQFYIRLANWYCRKTKDSRIHDIRRS
jgi:hypothetical protein